MTEQILNNVLGELNPDALPFGDPAVQWGAAGFFESLRVVARRVHLFEAHLRRLARSLELWKIEWPVDRAILLEAIRRELNRFPPNADLRLRITVGPAPDAPMNADGKWPPRVFVAASPMLPEYLAPPRERAPWKATIFRDYHVSSMYPLSGHKSAQYTLYWEARRRARARGFDEAILLNERGELVEASAANLFWIKGETIFTPAEECGCLPGVYASFLRACLAKRGIAVQSIRSPAEALIKADVAFLTNSVGGVIPLSFIDDTALIGLAQCPSGMLTLEIVDSSCEDVLIL